INMGRNVALDECSVARRSKYGRHVIAFNPSRRLVTNFKQRDPHRSFITELSSELISGK
ncbi:Transposase, partial [Phytophthora megakarya]